MKTTAKILCGAVAALWLQSAAAMGPGAATPANPHNPAVTDKVDQKATKSRLEKKGQRSKSLEKARKHAPQTGQ
jgi:hypothetical protein